MNYSKLMIYLKINNAHSKRVNKFSAEMVHLLTSPETEEEKKKWEKDAPESERAKCV